MGHRLYKNGSGGVAVRVIVAAASLIVLGGAIVTLLKTFEARNDADYRWAERISDVGIEEAFKKIAESNDWSEGFTNEPYPLGEEGTEGAYSVTVTREPRGDSLYIKIMSTGTVRSASQTQTRELVIPLDGQAGKDWPTDDAPSAPSEGI